jgi:hypothetical protein
MAGFSAFSQGTLLWQKAISMPNEQSLYTAAESSDNSFWVAVGSQDILGANNQPSVANAMVAFRADTGDTLWYRSFKSYYSNGLGRAWGVAAAPNNRFWVVITFGREAPPPTNRVNGIGVFEVDADGQILQHREYMIDCHDLRGARVHAMPDGGVLITGNIAAFYCHDWDLFALRLDASGEQTWQVTYVLPQNQNIQVSGLYPGNKLCMSYTVVNGVNQTTSYVVFADANTGLYLNQKKIPFNAYVGWSLPWPLRDGSFIVGGRWMTNPNFNLLSYGYLAHMDKDFNLLWERVDSNCNGYLEDIMKETTDGAFVIKAKRQPDPIHAPYNQLPFMAKINIATGQEIWRKYFRADTTNGVRGVPNDICVSRSGDLFGIGVGSFIGTSVGQTNAPDFHYSRFTGVADFLQPSDYCTDSVRANFTGTWQQDTLRLRSTSNSGMAYQDSLNYQWLIEGNTVSLDSAVQQVKEAALYPNGLPVTLVITNFWGCKDTLTAKVMPDGTVVGNKPNTDNRPYLRNAYPNPSTQHVSIGYTLPTKTENAVLRVYELGTGRTVAERHLSALDSEVKLNVSGWATGVYAYQLFVNGTPVAVKKMTVSR